ncbi:DUF2244 domain-containing protein [Reyranella sp. CPCC 100927]|uniref:DUF2244 domain-containing protein n=1 Tax=Reyranella sp. CPCC 100927 TaxID=2599616 RepID=UPI0011B81135|nr:DUF2244 domain-containing protein [Reyranella sp. CPCC 100927]TWT14826.1 DUF2244 domain-containing protein [Reyranella sp. CPCC 100927]
MSEAVAQAVHFNATLVPHRSLSRRGFRLLITVLLVANLLIGLPIFLLGAWPVIGFMGLDVALVIVLFRLNYKSGRLTETLTLTDDALIVTRIDPEGLVEESRLDAYWLRVEMDDPPEHESRLTLISRGNRLVVGRFLTPDERLEVAKALRTAIAGVKAPTYDHHWN